MRIFGYAWVAILVAVTTAQADTCVKQRSHTDSYYYGGRVTPARDSESELWIGKGRIAYLSANRQIIVDRTRNTVAFVNKQDSTYAEAPLPFDWSKFVDEETQGTLARYRTHGTVKQSASGEKIQEWKCHGYEMTSWIDTDHGKYNERDSQLWVTRDLPIDWDDYRAMNVHLLKLQNYDDELVAVLESIPGLVIRSEAQRFINGFSVDSIEEVIDVHDAVPGADIYSVPASFKKKESLNMADLRG